MGNAVSVMPCCEAVHSSECQEAGSDEEEEKDSTYSNREGKKKKKSYDVCGTLQILSSHDFPRTIQHLTMDLQEIGIKLQYNRLQILHTITSASVVAFSLELCQNRLSEKMKYHMKLAKQSLPKAGEIPYAMFDEPLPDFLTYSIFSGTIK